MNKLVTEFVGTFFLVLIIGLAVELGDVLAPLVIGVGLSALVYMGGHVSMAHYNPAATLGFWMRGTTKTPEAFRYIAVQLVAALSAAFVSLWLLNGATFSPGVGAEHSVWQALMAEFLFTFALVLVILNVAIAETTAGNQFYGIAIGFVVMAGAYAVWDISGAAFNPAVALGGLVIEAVVYDRSLEEAWIYLVGPLSGAAFAAVVFGWQQD